MANHYKDSLFRTLFNTEKAALEVYNAVHHTHYDAHTQVIINTLTDTLWTGQKNDVSFLIDRKLVVFAEHQSTLNENMPLRFLLPVVRLLEQSIPDKQAVYRKRGITLPRPDFLVFYNGVEPQPAVRRQYLSHAFEQVEGFKAVNLELIVKVYNINYRKGKGLLERSEHLRGYAYFVERARYYEGEERRRGTPVKEIALIAVRRAIKDCQGAKLLTDFWESLTMEDIIMLSTEWDWNLALQVRKEEGFEEGIEKGIEKGIGLGVKKDRMEILALMNQAKNLEDFMYLKEQLQTSIENAP